MVLQYTNFENGDNNPKRNTKAINHSSVLSALLTIGGFLEPTINLL